MARARSVLAPKNHAELSILGLMSLQVDVVAE